MQNHKISHEQYKEWIQLSIYDELNPEESSLLKEHLAGCESCRHELKELREFNSLIADHKPAEPDEETLLEARRELRTAIRIENSRQNFFERSLDAVKNFFLFNYKLALGGAAILLAGIMIGYLINKPAAQNPIADMQKQQQQQTEPVSGNDPLAQNDIKIDNLRIHQDPGASGGEISFSFDAVKPVTMKGNINDAMVQKVLAHALVNEPNDGVRLRTLNAIAAQTREEESPDPKIKAALIATLKYDNNPGVRREAILVLQRFPLDKEITDAFLYVLSNDSNSGLRIAAINSLSPDKFEGKQVNQELINVLEQKSQTDKNEYVRIRAKSVLQEVANNATL